jgi:uncharacterized protein (DUF1778 family)
MTQQRGPKRQTRTPGGRAARINIRTDNDTHDRLAERAAEAGLSLPRYLVESGLRDADGTWSLRQQRWWAERLEVVDTRLIRAGTNLKQIAAAANAVGRIDPGLAGAVAYHNETVLRLRRVLGAVDPVKRLPAP